jgi:hypothetical protein
VNPVAVRRSADGAADSTLDVCLIESRQRALPLEPPRAEAVQSQLPHAGTHKRPKRPVLPLINPLLAPPTHNIRVPIHISQVPRG